MFIWSFESIHLNYIPKSIWVTQIKIINMTYEYPCVCVCVCVYVYIYIYIYIYMCVCVCVCGRSQWPRGLRRRSAAACLLRSWVRIPPGAWMFVCCECCVLSGRGFWDKLITRPEDSYQLWCVVACDIENLKNEEAMTRVGSQRHSRKNIYMYTSYI